VRVEGPHHIVAVLGAINVDLVVSAAPLPRAGETVSGGVFAEHQGGKGGNQAVAAVRATAHDHILSIPEHPRPGVWMLGAVGDDQLGVRALEALRAEDVQTDHVLVTKDERTGVALIAVGINGENQISVAPGANAALTAAHVIEALETLRPHLLLASLEVPEAAVRVALEWAHDHQVPSILNPAPPHPWARALVPLSSFITPNEHELQTLGNVPRHVVVIETRGAGGARIHRGTAVEDIEAPAMNAVDTTGAGDCFNGVLAARLSEGRDLIDASHDAVVAAALSVQVAGAREGMPSSDQIAEARTRFGL
jgi:ribokinase